MNKSDRGRRQQPGKFKVGIVSEVLADQGKVRVKLPDQGIQTKPIAVVMPFTGNDKAYLMPDIGEQVCVMMDAECEDGVVIGAIYSKKDAPPVEDINKRHLQFQNGDFIEFDRSTGILKIQCTKVEIVTSEESTLQGKAIAVIGAVDSDGESDGPDSLVTSGQF